ncbi:MAG: hypothetical protein QOH63_1931 [Acidobacteriota bacterium]|jgi:hypothetical protein|nr:hypothetical protein [Acidobacteriota bacterium]
MQVLMLIAAVLGPLPSLIKVVRSWRAEKPLRKEKATVRKTGKRTFFQAYWLQLLFIALSASLLIWELSRPGLPDKFSVLVIVISVASILFQCVIILIFQAVAAIRRALIRQLDVNDTVLIAFKSVSTAIEEIVTHIPDEPQGITSKLRSTLKNLLGD